MSKIREPIKAISREECLKYMVYIGSLSVFGRLKEDPVIRCLCRLLEDLADAGTDPVSLCSSYSDVICALYPATSDLSRYMKEALLSDDNFYIQAVACSQEVDPEIKEAAECELRNLAELGGISCESIKNAIIQRAVEHTSGEGASDSDVDDVKGDGPLADIMRDLPRWTASPQDLSEVFRSKMDSIRTTGYGMFAEYGFFRICDGRICPVPHPDVQPLSELIGYEAQKEKILKNTRALLEIDGASSASNMLLYGDAGTGKSSTIKAVAKEYEDRGLRLIEIKKDQLMLIPMVLETISRQPLKFILFIDDLSFTGNDDNFSALKATLEGSVTGRGDNAVIYATSNRRHLIRETFSDRGGDELHLNDTLQETMSLAARFGLTVIFEKPDRDEYLRIVVDLAKPNDIQMPEDELIRKAEAHAIRRNGRSPRVARQFVELIKAGLEI